MEMGALFSESVAGVWGNIWGCPRVRLMHCGEMYMFRRSF